MQSSDYQSHHSMSTTADRDALWPFTVPQTQVLAAFVGVFLLGALWQVWPLIGGCQ